MQREELSGAGANLKKVSCDEYFRFVISGIETETVSFRGDSEFDQKIRMIRTLKTSANLLKDIFLISKVKKSELLATYLLFILKKIDENQITFENLIENYESDKEFLKKELVSQVKVKNEPPKDEPKIVRPLNRSFTETITQNETLQNEFLSDGGPDNEPVPQSDESMISEEAAPVINIETEDAGQDEPVMANITSLELVRHEREEEAETEKEVFSIPENSSLKETGQVQTDAEKPSEPVNRESNNMSDVFETSEESDAGSEARETESIIADAADEIIKEENQKETTKEKFNIKEKVEKLKKLFKKPGKPKTEIIPESAPEEEIVIKPAAAKEEQTIVIKPAETIQEVTETPEQAEAPQIAEVPLPEEEVTAEEQPAEHPEPAEPKRIHINAITEQYESVIPDEPAIHISEAEPDPEEIRFMEYLEKVMQTNRILKNEIGQHTNRINKNTGSTVSKNSLYLKEYSEEMSFEIITEIYYTISLYFDFYGNQDAIPETFEADKAVMLATLEFVEVFINGGEYNGSETLIKDIEAIKSRILDIKAEQERLEKLQKEKAELEKQLGEKFADTEQRKKLLTLKSNILEVESIFKSIDSINGEFQTYEAFRILSQTYSVFKSIVTQSNALEIEKMASLAESSYIFLKYIQNYRMNPFSEDIKEVLKYIIVNFKLLFLGKPTKDLDVFISYLNNPEKIFTQKEEPNDE